MQRLNAAYAASPVTLKRELREDLRHYQKMLGFLDANNVTSRRMIYEWADEHAHDSRFPF